VIVEANFHAIHSLPELAKLRERYGFEPLEIHCAAAAATLMDRYEARAASRHAGHADSERLIDVAVAIANGSNDALSLGGKVVVLDTTDFDNVDLEPVLRIALAHVRPFTNSE
jgi:hypothetical protein